MNSPNSLKIVSLNVWHGRLPRAAFLWLQSIEPRGQRSRRRAALLTCLRRLDADVLALQECLPQPAFSRALSRDLGGVAVVPAVANAGVRFRRFGLPIGLGTGEGVTLLLKTRLRPRPADVWTLSGGGRANGRWAAHVTERRVAVAATIQPRGRRGPLVGVVNTHLRYTFVDLDQFHHAWDLLGQQGRVRGAPPVGLVASVRREVDARDAELDALARHLRGFRRGVDGLIVAGDFNLDPTAPQLQAWATRLGLRNGLAAVDTEPRFTWEPRVNPHCARSATMIHPEGSPKRGLALASSVHDAIPQCPDHIFVGAGCEVHAGRLVADQPVDGTYVSDHFGVQLDVTCAG